MNKRQTSHKKIVLHLNIENFKKVDAAKFSLSVDQKSWSGINPYLEDLYNS